MTSRKRVLLLKKQYSVGKGFWFLVQHKETCCPVHMTETELLCAREKKKNQENVYVYVQKAIILQSHDLAKEGIHTSIKMTLFDRISDP